MSTLEVINGSGRINTVDDRQLYWFLMQALRYNILFNTELVKGGECIR